MPLQIFCRKNNPVSIPVLKRCMNALLRYAKRQPAHLEISLVGLQRIRKLNQVYLHKDRVTDVLSFPLDLKPIGNGPWHLGEIVIATPVAKAQAKKAGRSLNQQVVRLAVHGFVHLHGLDHEKSFQEKKRFETLEKKYLQYLNRKGLIAWDGLLPF